MKTTFLLWIWFVGIGTAYSQTITIKDMETKKPISGVTIFTDDSGNFAVSNAHGQAEIRRLRGSDKIQIRSLGYKELIKTYAELVADGFTILMETSNLNLDEVVVSGTRWQQVSGDIPAKIIAISAEQVAFQNPQTAADLLTISGKVYVQKSQQGGGSPIIRGFAANRLLYTIDGVRMNTAIFRGGNIQNVISLDPFAMDKTEVLFGPGSVIYGSDAIGGVMSFHTLTPHFSLNEKPLITGKAISRYSTANKEKTGHFDINVGWEKWALVTSFSTNDFDHLRQGSHGSDEYLKPYHVERKDDVDQVVSQADPLLQIPSAYSQINMMQKVRFQPNENWNFQYGFHYSATSTYGRYDRHNRTKDGTARYAEWNYGPQKWMMNNLNISHNHSTLLYDQMSIRLALQSFEESRIDRTLNNNSRNTQAENVQAYSMNIDFLKSNLGKNKLFYGFEYVLNDITSTGKITDISNGMDTTGPARYPQATWNSIAVYLNNEYRISKKMNLQAGLRYNQFMIDAQFDNSFYPFSFTNANINNGAITGSLGVVYRPSESWVISSNFGTAFRSPNVDDIGKVFDSEPGAVTVPNRNLQAEYAYNIDLGIAKVFNESIKLDITAYYTLLKNALVRRNFKLNDQDSIIYDGILSQVQAIQNAATANVYGLQGGLEVKLTHGFTFSSDLNYQFGEEELDDGTTSASRHAVPFFGTTRLIFHAKKWNMQVYSSFQGMRKFEDLAVEEQSKDEIYAKDKNGNNYSPAWYTINFKAFYQLSDLISISTGLENMTDQRYRAYSSGISAPGRNFILSLKANF
ncbi:MAG: hemoglobin/transferrin/lactoferrin receptor protein [Cyclobacteriaceae bacterium]|jgi:hemoglobin/transferrin/lactoferrin receptor protein